MIGGAKPLECRIEIVPGVQQTQQQQQQEHSFPPSPPCPPRLDATTTSTENQQTRCGAPSKPFQNNFTSKGHPPHVGFVERLVERLVG